MTEDEAKQRVCHQTLRGTIDNKRVVVANCIGGACMAWVSRSEHADTQASLTPEGDGWEKDGPDYGAGGATTHRQRWKRAVGRCGLVLPS